MALDTPSEPPVIVVGGSIAGLATALALGRLGRQVTVLERDGLTEFADAEAAFAVERQRERRKPIRPTASWPVSPSCCESTSPTCSKPCRPRAPSP